MRTLYFNGRLGKDAELVTTANGAQFLRFLVANNSYNKNEGEKTDWVDVTCFDPFIIKTKQAILKKGTYVIVSGELEVSTAVAQDGRVFVNQRVNANFVEVPNFGKSESGATATTAATAQAQPQMIPQNQPTAQPVAQPQMMPQSQPVAQPQVMPQSQPVYTAQVPPMTTSAPNDGTGDLPF
jgi:single stranded DNA-binding protein